MRKHLFPLTFIISLFFLSSTKAAETPMGPSLLFGLPHPINLAFDVKRSPEFTWGVALGSFSLPVPVSGYNSVTAGISNLDVRGRWHPFAGSFFLGGILGFQSLTGKTLQDIEMPGPIAVPVQVELKITGLYLTPHLGWIWSFGSDNRGFTFGLETGIQLPAKPKSELSSSIADPSLNYLLDTVKMTQPYRDLESKVETVANKIGKIAFPYFAIRFGYFF